MAWITENRRTALVETPSQPYLTDAIKKTLADTYFPRYPNKRAVLLPALHMIQHEHGWISTAAMQEVAAFLDLPPADVMDTASFYEEYWLKPKGQYLVQVCRSLSCEICGSCDLADRLKQKLGCELGETSPDGRFTLVELECLGSCGTAPVLMVNEVLHEDVKLEQLDSIIDQLPADAHEQKDATITWNEPAGH